jgi:hypothetical protein
MENVFIVVASQHVIRDFPPTFLEYPPRQKAATFIVDQILQMLTDALKSGS